MKIPLFPLNVVLFPEGELKLRIFEPRYIDMVSDCLRNNIGFGVCLIQDDKELDRQVAILDEKNRIAIANNLQEFEIQIEKETEIISEMENDCEKKLMNERFELFERMKLLKNGRTLLKGYGRSPRIKPKLKGSI